MKTETLEFNHNYYKLDYCEFTTIRGAGRIKKHNVGDIVNIEAPRRSFPAKISKLQKIKLSDIPLEVLKDDGAFPGFVVRNHLDFMGLINSMRKFGKLKSIHEEVTIITLVPLVV